ncbi:MAG: hypothetical protein PHQ14_06705 [Chromatiales bacterium]|jgi:hypothetical protein|nr:hypothetical protein [Chromatiales bacterium]MDX9767200.1 hypothetical protein [Ectothiorhodospiraceae bacterium]
MTTRQSLTRWTGPAAILAVAALGLLGYWAAGAWLRPLLAPVEAPVVALTVAPECDWSAGCETHGPLRARVRVDRRVHPLQPFELTLTVDADGVGTVLADFVMVGMDMGVNRFALAPAAARQWRTQVVLPVCTVDRQDWMAQIYVTAETGVYRIDVPFLTERE